MLKTSQPKKLSSVEQFLNMIHILHTVLFRQALLRFDDERMVVVLALAEELLKAQSLELLLDLREAQLDRVVLRRVGHVEDVADVEALHLRECLLRRVRGEVVEEDAELVVAVLLSQLLEEGLELRHVDGLREDFEVFEAPLLRDGGEQSERRLLQRVDIDTEVAFLPAPLFSSQSRTREHALVEVDDAPAVVLRDRQLPLHGCQVTLRLELTLALRLLAPAEFLLLDLVLSVDSAEQSSVHARVRELLLEVLAPIIQGEPYLALEG